MEIHEFDLLKEITKEPLIINEEIKKLNVSIKDLNSSVVEFNKIVTTNRSSFELRTAAINIRQAFENIRSCAQAFETWIENNENILNEINNKYNEKLDYFILQYAKDNGIRTNIKERYSKKQKKFNLEPTTVAVIQQLREDSLSDLFENIIKGYLHKPASDFAYKSSCSSNEKIPIQVWMKTNVMYDLDLRCKELKIKRNRFIENAIRNTYPDFFE